MELEYVVYNRQRAGVPRSCVVAIVPEEVRRERATLLLVRIPYKAQPNGLPVAGELSRVNQIEDLVSAALAPCDALNVGHMTCRGSMTAVYCAPKSVPGPLKLKTSLFKSVELAVESRAEEAWNWFDAELAPTPEEREFNLNRPLHATLQSHGDNESKLRPVDFTFYFSDPAAFFRSGGA